MMKERFYVFQINESKSKATYFVIRKKEAVLQNQKKATTFLKILTI